MNKSNNDFYYNWIDHWIGLKHNVNTTGTERPILYSIQALYSTRYNWTVGKIEFCIPNTTNEQITIFIIIFMQYLNNWQRYNKLVMV